MQHESAGVEDPLGLKSRETLGDGVGIYELLHGPGAGEDVSGGRCFAGAVGVGDYSEDGPWRAHDFGDRLSS